jgi:pimeloyl-ACP methyl ester carboxylesterase
MMNQFKSVVLWLAGVGGVLITAILIWAWAPDKNRADLEKIYAPAPSAFIKVLDMRVHYRDLGPLVATKTAPQTLIFLHGFGSSLHTWDAWAPSLAQNYRVVSLDLPGFGLTGANPSGDYSDAFVMQLLSAFTDQLGIQSAVWIGNSMGGRYAWEMAVAHPQRVDKLVLISPDGFASKGSVAAVPLWDWELGQGSGQGSGLGEVGHLLSSDVSRDGLNAVRILQ